MSTQRLASGRAGNISWPTFSVLGGLLIALQLWLSLAFTSFAFAHQDPATLLTPPQSITRAGVSVVRLVVYYTDMNADNNADHNIAPVTCMGLGGIVASYAVGTQFMNWVLTDGNLVSKADPTCAGRTNVTLTSMQIFFSTAYSTQPSAQMLFIPDPSIPERSIPNLVASIQCVSSNTEDCTKSPAIFAFTTSVALPYIDMATPKSTAIQGLILGGTTEGDRLNPTPINSGNTPSPTATAVSPTVTATPSPSELLTPNLVQDLNTFLSGTPLVNDTGELTGVHLSQGDNVLLGSFQDRLNKIIKITDNHVHKNWKDGMDAYYHVNNNQNPPHPLFLAAYNANPQFQGAKTYADITATVNPTPTSTVQSTSSAESSAGLQAGPVFLPYWQLGIAGLILLLALLLIFTLLTNRTRRERKRRLDADLIEAESRSTIEAQRIREMEAVQRNWAAAAGPAAAGHSQPLPVPSLRCPRCGESVLADANYCSNCRLLLSPTESGLHLKVMPNSTPASAPNRAVADHPTVVPASSIVEQPTLVQGPLAAEQPTIEMSPSANVTTDKVSPYAMRQMKGRRLGFVAGTRSDPGIKRKYKPNEDSLFAAQGLINGTSTPPVFGLFVVADGMGGHANGEDASRLAIQTIIDYVLPRLLKNGVLQEGAYAQLLVEGIQNANQAVHQSNLDQHGDMGTTVTAALVVDIMAYVANVGDSRTYLYRAPEGLRKVTTDHSVVASLVEAGIIKPDDIYTHPKRNQIYRSLGEKPTVDVDHFIVQLQEGDKLLLCSDGLWDMVRDPQIEKVLKNSTPDPKVMGEALIKEALAGGGEDNVSVIVVHITEQGKAGSMPRIQLLTKPDSVQMPQL